MIRKHRTLVASVVALSLVAAACGDDDDAADAPAADDSDDAATSGDDATDGDMAEDEGDMAEDEGDMAEDEGDMAEDEGDMAEDDGAAAALPGTGVSVTMAKADWATEDPNAYVARAILQELGYEVSDPKDLELGPANAYIAMAQGDADFWINSWYPGHNSWLANELPDGSLVGDHLTVTGEMMMAGGLQGFLITKSFAEEFGITSLDDFNNNPDAIAAYDAQDPADGNGVADIYGCQESWTCDDIITAQIAFSGWENIAQTIAGYDAMVAEAVTKADAGEPMIIYTWTPSAYITQLRPGDNVMWIPVENVLDDSNPTGAEGGEGWDQRPGIASIGGEQCLNSTGDCQLGWIAADVQVTANTEWLDANPAAAAFLEQFQMNVLDVSLLNVDMDAGADVQELAAGWIADNRPQVDEWIATAVAAAG